MKINIKENKEIITNLLKSTERENIKSLIDHLSLNGFFKAPCSKNHHLNIEGGLAQHSLNVLDAYQTLKDDILNRQSASFFGVDLRIPESSEIITCLLHDTCKIDQYDIVPDGIEYNHDTIPLGHGEKSLFLISEHIQLSIIESVMIRWHMGPYDSGDYFKYQKQISKYPEAILLHFADNYATHFIDPLYEYEVKP